ncbi:MAG TPA: peptidoglycan DD-metalloendopeptidase family protein [Actinomycetota bacterium]|nr:peptidoglycan DD-metalloendopeptidase family protein [Actinomycetota bacterium]
MRRTSLPRTATAALVAAVLLLSGQAGQGLAADSASTQKELDAVAAAYERAATQLAATEAREAKLRQDLKDADRIIAQRAARVKERAEYVYKNGGVGTFLSDLLLAPDMSAFVKRMYYLELLGDYDSKLVEGLQVTQSRADAIWQNLEATKAKQKALAEELKEKRRQLEARFKAVKGADKVKRLGNFSSFILPVSPSAFANTWGARRSGGRRHKGTDVMAPCGAPVIAVTDGVISNLHSGGNGGIMAYLRASNGDVFFYAHLRRYAPGVSTGTRVSAGDLIAYNGNTGNARGGACHVHFEWHPRGGGPVNPYPLLAGAR